MLRLPGRRETTEVMSSCATLLTDQELPSTSTVKTKDLKNATRPLQKVKVANSHTLQAYIENYNSNIVNGCKHICEEQNNVGSTQNRTSQSSSYSSTSLSSSFTPQDIVIHEPVAQYEEKAKETDQAPQSNCFLTVNVNNFCNNSNTTKFSTNRSNNYTDNVERKEKKYNPLQECSCSNQFYDIQPPQHNSLDPSGYTENEEMMTLMKKSAETVLSLPCSTNNCDDVIRNNVACITSERTTRQETETENFEKQWETQSPVVELCFSKNIMSKYEQNDNTLQLCDCSRVVAFEAKECVKHACTSGVNTTFEVEEQKHDNNDNNNDDDEEDDFVLQATSEMKAKITLLKEPRKPSHSIGNWARVLPSRCNSSKLQKGVTCPLYLMPTITKAEVKKHNIREDMWMVIDDIVYDITKFASYHPGGGKMLERCSGKDATALYYSFHPWVSCEAILGKFVIGKL